MTHPVLLEQIWGPAYVEDRQALRTHIANLRRKIELGGARSVIRTEHGVGYRFAAATPLASPPVATLPTSQVKKSRAPQASARVR